MNKPNSTSLKWWLISSSIAIAVIAVTVLLNISQPTTKSEAPPTKIRIVSLIPSLTQSIYYLQAQDKLVGCTSYCKTAASDSIEVVASVVKPNVEKIVSLKPDLILVSGLISEKDVVTFRKFGIRVETFRSPKSFDEICNQFIRLGKLVNSEDKARLIVEESKTKALSIQKEFTQRQVKPKIFMQIGADPIYTVIPNTFMNDYITYCGAINIAAELTIGTIGREFVVSQNPDYIFVVTMGIVGEKELEQWNQFSQMKAIANKKTFIINSDIACQPTPITFIQTLELINKQIAQ